ncbi:extracellular solute-binding protein [Planomonospora sp. ID67723]|uniref:ABC transporter substrate-binding protein n=1 Tax=Planomonospora sp. ID67723 TaxID=2738134 RepID=UPI0018C36261|nr:extracellular solute-binding protein [Planomonospora sp. ID67723]MBG0833462.1 extracellular solute-binding protein [Planomonospora sp. ID67723]
MTVRSIAAAAFLLATIAGCSAPAVPRGETLPPVKLQAASLAEGFTSMERLVEAARKEGSLTVIALARDWVNYGEIIDAFSEEYGIKVTELEPGASSQRQIEAASTLRPDVFDLSLEVAVANTDSFAPYKVRGWQDIPDDLKDPEGTWYAAYGGYMSIGYDSRRVAAPASYADLLEPGHSVWLPGDPRRSAAAFGAVMGASLDESVGEDGEDESRDADGPDAERGVEFFARLKEAGNLAEAGQQPSVVLDWDFLNAARAARGTDSGPGWKVAIPGESVLASYYVQAVSKDAPHPAAARLWQEFLLSDRGQNLFLKGYARPVRTEAMRMRGTLDPELARRLPATTAEPVILTVPKTDAAKAYLQREWAGAVEES